MHQIHQIQTEKFTLSTNKSHIENSTSKQILQQKKIYLQNICKSQLEISL